MYAEDYMPSTDEPLVKAFTDMFGGRFGMDMTTGFVIYTYRDNSYPVPETKMRFFDLLSQAVKEKNNLFLTDPIDYTLSEGEVY